MAARVRSNIQVFVKEFWQTLSEIIYSDKKHRFEFQPLDMLDVEDTDVVVLSNALAVRAGHGSDASLGNRRIQRCCKWFDFLFTVYQNGY